MQSRESFSWRLESLRRHKGSQVISSRCRYVKLQKRLSSFIDTTLVQSFSKEKTSNHTTNHIKYTFSSNKIVYSYDIGSISVLLKHNTSSTKCSDDVSAPTSLPSSNLTNSLVGFVRRGERSRPLGGRRCRKGPRALRNQKGYCIIIIIIMIIQQRLL